MNVQRPRQLLIDDVTAITALPSTRTLVDGANGALGVTGYDSLLLDAEIAGGAATATLEVSGWNSALGKYLPITSIDLTADVSLAPIDTHGFDLLYVRVKTIASADVHVSVTGCARRTE
jgi:hypothetical protein